MSVNSGTVAAAVSFTGDATSGTGIFADAYSGIIGRFIVRMATRCFSGGYGTVHQLLAYGNAEQ